MVIILIVISLATVVYLFRKLFSSPRTATVSSIDGPSLAPSSPAILPESFYRKHSINSNTIRVLSLRPAQLSDEIRCEMKIISLQQHYEALSYECTPDISAARTKRLSKMMFNGEDPIATKRIYVNDHPVEVSWTLH